MYLLYVCPYLTVVQPERDGLTDGSENLVANAQVIFFCTKWTVIRRR